MFRVNCFAAFLLFFAAHITNPAFAAGEAQLVVHNNTDATITVIVVGISARDNRSPTVTIAPNTRGSFGVQAGYGEVNFIATRIKGEPVCKKNIVLNAGRRHEFELFPSCFGLSVMFDRPTAASGASTALEMGTYQCHGGFVRLHLKVSGSDALGEYEVSNTYNKASPGYFRFNLESGVGTWGEDAVKRHGKLTNIVVESSRKFTASYSVSKENAGNCGTTKLGATKGTVSCTFESPSLNYKKSQPAKNRCN